MNTIKRIIILVIVAVTGVFSFTMTGCGKDDWTAVKGSEFSKDEYESVRSLVSSAWSVFKWTYEYKIVFEPDDNPQITYKTWSFDGYNKAYASITSGGNTEEYYTVTQLEDKGFGRREYNYLVSKKNGKWVGGYSNSKGIDIIQYIGLKEYNYEIDLYNLILTEHHDFDELNYNNGRYFLSDGALQKITEMYNERNGKYTFDKIFLAAKWIAFFGGGAEGTVVVDGVQKKFSYEGRFTYPTTITIPEFELPPPIDF